jgi:hypothetical protein
VWVVEVLEDNYGQVSGHIKEFGEMSGLSRPTIGTEQWVTLEMLRYLSQLFCEDDIYFGEIAVVGGNGGPLADIVIGHPTDIDIAIECKGSDSHRKGIGQAMVYDQLVDYSGLAVYEGESYIRDALLDTGVSFWEFQSTRMTTMDDGNLL